MLLKCLPCPRTCVHDVSGLNNIATPLGLKSRSIKRVCQSTFYNLLSSVAGDYSIFFAGRILDSHPFALRIEILPFQPIHTQGLNRFSSWMPQTQDQHTRPPAPVEDDVRQYLAGISATIDREGKMVEVSRSHFDLDLFSIFQPFTRSRLCQ